MKRILAVLLLSLCLLMPAGASADNLARDYIPAAPGTLAILLYYNHVWADSLYRDGHKVADDVDFQGNIGLFRPVYFTKLGPFVWDPQFILPFGHLELGDDLSTTGVGDPIVFATIWFVNRPQSKTWLGFTPFFFIPIGEYDNDGLLSLGENRWRFREEVGLVQGFEVFKGHDAFFELQVGVDLFTENDDFGPESQSLEQNPIFNLESHLSYDVTRSLWISADYYFHAGGETEVDGVDGDDSLSNHILGATVAWNFAEHYQFLVQYKGDVEVESGLKTQTVQLRFLYAFDLDKLIGRRCD